MSENKENVTVDLVDEVIEPSTESLKETLKKGPKRKLLYRFKTGTYLVKDSKSKSMISYKKGDDIKLTEEEASKPCFTGKLVKV